jgi:hypothetical protein
MDSERYGELFARLILFFLLMLGFLIVSDYGVTYDEYVNRRNGGVSLNYISQLIGHVLQIPIWPNDPVLALYRIPLESYIDRDYGVAFDLPVMAIERLLQINDPRNQYLFRHALTYIVFLLGCWSLYKTIAFRFSSSWLGVVALVMMILSPRIFADAFYNSKDIVFMSAVAIATYAMQRMFYRKDIASAIFFGLATAFAINIRIIAVIFVVASILIFAFEWLNRRRSLPAQVALVYVTATVGLTIGFWPWLWGDPVTNFMVALNNMSNFRWQGWVLYSGNYYTSTDLPRQYLLVWILISTPLLYSALFCVGVYSIIKTTLRNNVQIWKNSAQLQDLIFLGLFLSPILFVFFKRSVVYDGWRQFYFVYPAFICVAIRGLTCKPASIALFKLHRVVLALLLCLTAASLTVWMIRQHPFQNLYFNVLGPKGPAQSFELDYWGTSNVKVLRFLLAYQPTGSIRVLPVGITALSQSLVMLDEAERKRIQIVDEVGDADFSVTNFRFINPQQREFFDGYTWSSIYEIVVDKHIISSVFKKR